MKKIKKNILVTLFALSTFVCINESKLIAAENVIEDMSDGGDVVAAWQEFNTTTSHSVIMAATKPAAGSWSSPEPISDPDVDSNSPVVVVNDVGNAVVGWLSDDAVNGVVALNARMFLFGGSWTDIERLSLSGTTPTESVVGLPDFEISDSSGTVKVTAVWTAVLGTNVFSSARANTATFGGSWSGPETISAQ